MVVHDQQVPAVSNPVLQDFLEQLEALRMDARELTAGLNRTQFNWRPTPRRWSIGQCLQHVVLTARLYPEPIERMIAESKQRKARGYRGYGEGLFSRWLIGTMEPPPKLRVRSPRRVEPDLDLDPATVTAAFDELHARFGELMVAADGVSLAHARMASPFLPILRLTLRQTFAINLAHGRRHLWQAWLVRKASGFPDGPTPAR